MDRLQLKRRRLALTIALVVAFGVGAAAQHVRLNGLSQLLNVTVAGIARFANGTSSAPSIASNTNPFDGWFWSSTGHWVYTANGNPNIDFGTGISLGSGTSLGFTASSSPAGGATDVAFTRAGIGIFSAPSLRLTAPALTAGSGTGITVDDTGALRQLVYKVSIGTTALICAAVTCDVTVATLPAKAFVTHTMVAVTTAFTCAATCTTSTLSATLGKTAGGNEYLLSFDADAAIAQFGTTAAQLGASLTGATVPTELGDLASWTATTAVVMRFTSGTGNIGTGAATNLGVGSMTFYITAVVMP